MTKATLNLYYSSVISKDSAHLYFLIADVNYLDTMACDVGNAYLNVLYQENICFAAGPEHGP